MIKNLIVRFIVSLSLVSSLLVMDLESAWAQKPQAKAEETAQLTGPRKQLATIIFAGLAGAILGLSTLSFYGRPQDHLQNIALGFAVGVIGGTSWATFKAATAPEEFYGADFSSPDWQPDLTYDHSRKAAYQAQLASHISLKPVQWQWTF